MTRNHFYYLLKPLIPRKVQIELRRMIVAQKRARYADVWPIDERAGTPPEGWAGWPDGKKFALILTHDVETAKGHKNCRKLMELEEKLGFRSSFGFVPERYTVSPELRKDLQQRGFEVSVHGLLHDGLYYRSREVFRKRAARINHYLKDWGAVGFRSPSMLHNLDWLHDLKVEYDSSTFDTDPFEPQPDGVGTIFPFWVPRDGKKDGYVEIPYTLPQDHSLFILMKEKDISIWKRKLDWIAEKGGMALIITHPDYMHFGAGEPSGEEYPSRFYEEFLKYAQTKYAGEYWQVLPKDLAGLGQDIFKALRSKRFQPVLSEKSQKEIEPRRRLRVAMLAYSFYDSDARVSRYAETLVRRGDHVDVFALGQNGQGSFNVVNGVNVYRIQKRERNEKGKLSFATRMLRFFIKSSLALSKKDFEHSYDVVHVHSVPDSEVFAAWFSKMRGAKVILDIHDIVPEFYAAKFKTGKNSRLYRILLKVEKMSAAFSDHVIISNHLWEKTICRSVNGGKCSAILNYPDQEIFYRRPRQRSDNKFIMLYPGTLNWHQGLDIAVRAFGRIAGEVPQAEFHIYGKGDTRDLLASLIDQLDLRERVFIYDPLPKEKIAEVMANADLGIVPKRNDSFGGEAFSTKTLEFMSLGVPIIVSATKIDKYYFNDSVVQFFEPEDEADLAQRMLCLAKDGEARTRLVTNASEFLKEYSWDNKKHLYLDLVDSLVGKK